jgi:hypothetical protein
VNASGSRRGKLTAGANMAKKAERCPTCRRLMKRSNPQNRFYWLLIHQIAENVKPQGKEYSPEVWHEWAKQRFIGADEINLPNGKTMIKGKSSADLDTAAFAEYMRSVEEFAMSRNVYLDEINPT